MGLPNFVAVIGSAIAIVGLIIAECSLASVSSNLDLESILYILFMAVLGFMLFKGKLFHEDIMKVIGAIIGISATLSLFFTGVLLARIDASGSHGGAAGLFIAVIGTGIISFCSLF